MRILIDERLNWRLSRAPTGHYAVSTQKMGWAGLKNGVLLMEAEKQFDVFITGDLNLNYSADNHRTAIMNSKRKTSGARLAELDIDKRVEAQADDQSAWGRPVKVRRGKTTPLALPADLAARATIARKMFRAGWPGLSKSAPSLKNMLLAKQNAPCLPDKTDRNRPIPVSDDVKRLDSDATRSAEIKFDKQVIQLV